MASPGNPTRIGALRWQCILATRAEVADPANPTRLIEAYTVLGTVRCDIQPLSLLTFLQAEQIDTPLTHRIYTRYLGYVSSYDTLIRVTTLPDGSERHETFRVHRIGEYEGRKRYSVIDAELEAVPAVALALILPTGEAVLGSQVLRLSVVG